MTSYKVMMLAYHSDPSMIYGKETGGMNVYVLELSKALAKQGHSIDIFTRQIDSKSKPVKIANNVRLIPIPAGPYVHVSKHKLHLYVKDFVQGIRKFMRSDNVYYDIIHCHYYLSGLAGLSMKKSLSSAPLLMTFHTLGMMKNLVARHSLEKETQYRIEAETHLSKRANHIIALSDKDRDYIQYLYDVPKNKISVISPGVDTKIFRPINKMTAKQAIGADFHHKLILFVGRIEPLKGIDSLFYALKILFVQNPKLKKKVCLWIVGGDITQQKSLWSEELKKLEKLRYLLGLQTQVVFVGQKPQNKLPFYYNASEMLVMPSHYETFGIVALEALSCGIPVISTHVSGISRLAEDSKDLYIIPANSPVDLADQMAKILTDTTKYKKIRHILIRQSKHNISWDFVARHVAAVYAAFFSTAVDKLVAK